MNLKVLLEQFSASPRLFQLADKLSFAQPPPLRLLNLQGSSPAFVFATIFQSEWCRNWNHVVICEDPESAAYLHNSIENLLHPLNLFYFPSSFKNRKNFRLLNPSHVMLRTEALTRFAAATGERAGALITYPEALFEKVVLPDTLSKNIIYIKTGDVLGVDQLMEKLVNFGFERTDFVYEPGQFALRGGILDIYSFGNEKPYRVELFGNDVESIRIVDPETQLSERKLLQVSIIPNIETRFASAEKTTFFEFLPRQTVFWCFDRSFILEKIALQEEDLQLFLNLRKELASTQTEEEDPSLHGQFAQDDFITAAQADAFLDQFPVIGINSKAVAKQPGDSGPAEEVVSFSTRPQPAFNRQFDLLIKDLQDWVAKGFQVYLFAENPRQLERLHTIFEDLKAEIPFVPVPESIHEGFIDEDAKVVCYTDHQIFQRYHKYKVKQAYNKNKAITLRTLKELQPGDFVTHIDHGVGVFSGLQKIDVNGKLQEAVRLIYRDNDILYVNINSLHKISKYTGKEGSTPRINKLGSDTWAKLKEKTKSRVKDIAFDLIKLYAQRKARQGFAFAPDNYMQTELEASFIYEDTPDQSKTTLDVKRDMESPSPMDRLVCGDVGFGKTEIAIRAAFKACVDGKQAAVLVPTTILAFQHYKTFRERLR
ncbi:MAG: transcription-repair coupling factor, partial [Bacteroidota bacterium]